MLDLRSEVYNALSDICFKYRDTPIDILQNTMDRAIEWFQTHFWEDEDLDESLHESLGATDVVRELYNTFPKIEFLDERDYGDDVALFFKLGGDVSGLEDYLNSLSVNWKIANGKLRIIAPEDEDYLDEDCEVTLKSNVDEKEDAGDVEKGIENFNSMTESTSNLPSSEEIESVIYNEAKDLMNSFGFPYDEIDDYLFVEVYDHTDEDGDDFLIIEVRAELSYKALVALADHLNGFVKRIDKDAYFEPLTSGIIECWIKK